MSAPDDIDRQSVLRFAAYPQCHVWTYLTALPEAQIVSISCRRYRCSNCLAPSDICSEAVEEVAKPIWENSAKQKCLKLDPVPSVDRFQPPQALDGMNAMTTCRWAFEQVVAALSRPFQIPTSPCGQSLLYAGHPSACQGALARALSHLGQACSSLDPFYRCCITFVIFTFLYFYFFHFLFCASLASYWRELQPEAPGSRLA